MEARQSRPKTWHPGQPFAHGERHLASRSLGRLRLASKAARYYESIGRDFVTLDEVVEELVAAEGAEVVVEVEVVVVDEEVVGRWLSKSQVC